MRDRRTQRALKKAGIRREEPLAVKNEEQYFDLTPHGAVTMMIEEEKTVKSERIKYKFLFRCPGEDPVMVIHDTRPGDAEICARKMARIVAKKQGWAEAACVWMGPAEQRIPEAVREELRKERFA